MQFTFFLLVSDSWPRPDRVIQCYGEKPSLKRSLSSYGHLEHRQSWHETRPSSSSTLDGGDIIKPENMANDILSTADYKRVESNYKPVATNKVGTMWEQRLGARTIAE